MKALKVETTQQVLKRRVCLSMAVATIARIWWRYGCSAEVEGEGASVPVGEEWEWENNCPVEGWIEWRK
jgi:hypothetical protein